MRSLQSFGEFKRRVYLFILPLGLVALVIYNVTEPFLKIHSLLYLIMTQILMVWFAICWYFVIKNRYIKVLEFFSLAFLSVCHVATLYDTIFHYLAKGDDNAIGVWIIWVPLILICFFLILETKWGTIFSLIVFLIVLSFGVINIHKLSIDGFYSLCQFYLAYLFYILILYFTQFLFRLFADLNRAKYRARTDALTGIANRYQIDDWLEHRLDKFDPVNEPWSIIFFDVDHFKKINDSFGHKVGDSVLEELTQLVKRQLKETTLFGRWGGEEFIVVTPQDRDGALALAEVIRQAVATYAFFEAGYQTVSLGVTELRKGDTVDELLSRVDQGLYQSKREGRNRVTVA